MGGRAQEGPSRFLGPSLSLPWTLNDLEEDTSLPGLSGPYWDVLGMV